MDFRKCNEIYECIVDEIPEKSNVDTAAKWAKQLVSEFNNSFPALNLLYIRNAITNGITYISNLNGECLSKNVARLAMMVYEDFIRGGSFLE